METFDETWERILDRLRVEAVASLNHDGTAERRRAPGGARESTETANIVVRMARQLISGAATRLLLACLLTDLPRLGGASVLPARSAWQRPDDGCFAARQVCMLVKWWEGIDLRLCWVNLRGLQCCA